MSGFSRNGGFWAWIFDSLPTAVVGAVPTSVLFLPALRSFSIHLLPLWHAWFLAMGWLVFSILSVCCWVYGHTFCGVKFADCALLFEAPTCWLQSCRGADGHATTAWGIFAATLNKHTIFASRLELPDTSGVECAPTRATWFFIKLPFPSFWTRSNNNSL